MKTLILTIALFLPLQAQDLGNRALRGPSVWVLDSAGIYRAANLDPATLVLDPPGTTGARPTLRAIIPPASSAPVRMRVLSFTYAGASLALTEAPAANTAPIVFWGALYQPPENYTLTGSSLLLRGTGWTVGDKLTVIYFY